MPELELNQLNPNANVRIYMKGLGVAHHNTTNGRWEFLFIRKIAQHDLRIVVREFRNGETIPFRETPYSIPNDTTNLEIVTTDSVPIPAGGFHHKPSGNNFRARRGFDRNEESRWMIDLSAELHGEPVPLRRKNYTTGPFVGTPVALTLLTVSDAVFYTASLSKRPYSIKFNRYFCFSRVVGEWMGFDIEWKPNMGKTDIKFNTAHLADRTLPRDENIARYEIEVNNDCCEGQVGRPSDFHYYYDLLVNFPPQPPKVFDEDVSLPTSHSNAFTETFNAESFNIEAFKEFLSILLGGKEDDCHLVACSDLVGMTSLAEVLLT